MTLQDVFNKAVELGDFPLVKINREIVRYATSNIGKIVCVKHTGIAVRFEGMTWNIWFWDKPGTDRRSHHMNELRFTNDKWNGPEGIIVD